MKKIFLVIIITFFFCECQKKHEALEINPKLNNDIDEIVEAVIIQDSLNVFKNNPKSEMFCSELKRVQVHVPEKRKDGLVLPSMPEGIYIYNILNDTINGEVLFSTKDSLNILAQNLSPAKIRIGKTFTDKLNLTTREKEMIKRENEQPYSFYEMSIPIFSLDKQKVYVEVNYYCGRLCGGGESMYLKKINGQWIIIKRWQTWIS